MSANSTQSTDLRTYSSPGKVFILGEYAVLQGLPALVAAVGPRFEMGIAPRDEERAPSYEGGEFHPQSPVARLVDWAQDLKASDYRLNFTDAHQGAGGFGGSTAQFALAYKAYAELENWDTDPRRVWRLYRELTHRARGFAPSGADLAAQWNGGVVRFDPQSGECEDFWKLFDWSNVMVFSAAGQTGRKVATHEHLAALEDPRAFAALAESLRAPLEKGLKAVQDGSVAALGEAMNEYADLLRGAGLEIPATTEDRKVLGGIRGVAGVKGAGALQADAIVVLLDPSQGPQARAATRIKVIAAASSRELALVCDGLEYQDGVSCLH